MKVYLQVNPSELSQALLQNKYDHSILGLTPKYSHLYRDKVQVSPCDVIGSGLFGLIGVFFKTAALGR